MVIVVSEFIMFFQCCIYLIYGAYWWFLDDVSDHVPLLKSSGSESNAINVEDEQKQQQPQVENSQETPHDKTDTVTDIKEELCDLSMYQHIWDMNIHNS